MLHTEYGHGCSDLKYVTIVTWYVDIPRTKQLKHRYVRW